MRVNEGSAVHPNHHDKSHRRQPPRSSQTVA
jgi:hypothetical protein